MTARTTTPLRAGVIGAGVFGGYHAQKWASFPDVRLTAVLDLDPARAQALAARHGAMATPDLEAFLAEVDVVSIATPATSHADWALKALRAGRPCYVEKPLATDMEAASALVEAAARAQVPLACGFLERAAFQAIGLACLPERPLLIEAIRVGSGDRNLDVSVVMDLMIHDLDLALSLTPSEPVTVEGEGRRLRNSSLDEARAEVTFEDGMVARFEASRVSTSVERRMRLVFASGEAVIDFAAGSLEDRTPFGLDAGFARKPEAADRLAASLRRFVEAVRDEGRAPLAGGVDGLRALDLVLAVEQAAEESL